MEEAIIQPTTDLPTMAKSCMDASSAFRFQPALHHPQKFEAGESP